MTQDSQPRCLCVAVDDFGLHPGVDDAALRLVDAQRVQAIGCLVGGISWAQGSRRLGRLDPQCVDLGLHLDLTEAPLLAATRRPLHAWLRDSFLRRLDRSALRSEIRAQLDAFELATGRRPAYVDGHQHVHQLPGVRDELLHELGRCGARDRPWLRSTLSPRRARSPLAKPWLIEHLGGRGLASLARRSGFRQNQHLLGVYDFSGGVQRYGELLGTWLRSAVDGDLLMCHPAAAARGVADALIEARQAEFRVLSGAAFPALLRDAGLVLQPMSQILERRSKPA